MYRSHGIPKTDIIQDINKYLIEKKHVENHLAVGNFNIDLPDCDYLSQEFLCNFFKQRCISGIGGMTKPHISIPKESCIDDIFVKTNNSKARTYRLKLSIMDLSPLFIAVNEMITENHEQIIFLNYEKLYKIVKNKTSKEIMRYFDSFGYKDFKFIKSC